jgi:peptidoglycan biosynthesis protein MviN/MurJ (putative lipid II flippase)
VYYTNLAEHAAAGQTAQFAAEVANAMRAVLFFIAPLGFFLFALAEPLCAVLLDFGAFGDDAIALTTAVVAWVAIATVVRGPVGVQENAILADPRAEHLTFAIWSTSLSLIVRLALVIALLPGSGLIAVVYAAIGATLFKLFFGFAWLGRRRGLQFHWVRFVHVAMVLCLAAAAAAGSAGLFALVSDGMGRLVQAVTIGACVSVAALAYVFATAASGIAEGQWMRATLIKRLSRIR